MRKMKSRYKLRILVVIATIVLGITGFLREGESAIPDGIMVEKDEFRGLTKSEAEEVIKIWRVISDQEIVEWSGKEWAAKTEEQKSEAIEKVCAAWEKAGYKRIESVDYFVEDIDKYYNHHGKKDPEEGLKGKVGLVVSLSAFFAGMGKGQE